MFEQMRMKFTRFMLGRNGYDPLNYGLLLIYIIFGILQFFMSFIVFQVLSSFLLAVFFYRFLSKDLAARSGENGRFLHYTSKITDKVKVEQRIFKDKNHLYFRCPNCNHRLRVPKGKGSLKVTCRICHYEFKKKS